MRQGRKEGDIVTLASPVPSDLIQPVLLPFMEEKPVSLEMEQCKYRLLKTDVVLVALV